MVQIRDFIIAHYKVTRRNDSEYWRYCQRMALPDSLAQKLEIFAAHGRVHRVADELFREDSWVQVLLGQGLQPSRPDPLCQQKSLAEMQDFAESTAQVIAACTAQMPTHTDFIRKVAPFSAEAALR